MAKLTFDDEFNSLSLWSGSSGTWQPAYSWSPNGFADSTMTSWLANPGYGPTSQPDANPYSAQNGVLGIAFKPTPADVNPSDVGGRSFISGQLTTKQSFAQEYGYFEMRAELPAAAGLNSAFWLLPSNGSWPPELDVEEVLGNDPTTLVMTAHSSNGSGGDNATPQWATIPNASQGYHVYAVDWEANTVTWYFDGKQMAQVATPSDWHQPMYMLLDTLSGTPGSWMGAPNPGETAAMKIDYVRAYDSNPYTGGAANPDWNNTSAPSGSSSGPPSGSPSGAKPSPDNTVITAARGGSITDASGNAWSIVNGQVAVNGAPDGQSANVIELAYEKGLIWQENADHLWWSKSRPSDTWSPGPGTATSPVPASTVPPDQLTLALSEDAYQGNAQFIVKMDGKQLGAAQSVTALHSAGKTQGFTFTGAWGAGAHNVEIDFINDAYGGPGKDRNLYVNQVTYDGHAALTKTDALFSNGGVTIHVGQ